ncbi:MAG: glycosyltransferase [Candidatus Latescibacteria bacterium]|nr:glycosyltransferase [Candidatus Latescibacterota bacterium]NIO57424.1 glycosyltransferase [Candidatus Latescibacterota bacterium]
MKIIVAIPYAPWPVTRGTDRLILNLLDGLADNHDVVLVTAALSKGELERLREIEKPRIGVRAILAPHRQSAFHRIYYKVRNISTALFAGVPAQVGYAAPKRFLQLVADTAKEEKADLILASYWHLYRLPDYIEHSKLVLITHDLDFIVNPGRLQAMSGFARFWAAIRLKTLERIEKMAYERYETILTVTPSDADVLGRLPATAGLTVYPLPLALDLSSFNSGAFERERNRILFIGMFYSDFNRDALRFFMKEVFPIVLAKNPAAHFEVVGHGVDKSLRAAAGVNVAFVGGVEDIRPYIGKCSVMVLPLRFCGGVRIRMMEAAAMGTPVVSTSIGVSGMGLKASRDYLEAESTNEMAEAIVKLLEDSDEARRIGNNARLWAEENISMESYPARLDTMLKKITAST